MSTPTHSDQPMAFKRPPRFSAFALRLVVYFFAVSLLFSLAGLHLHLVPLQRAIALVVTAAANRFGAHATFSSYEETEPSTGTRLRRVIIDVERASLEINHECTGVYVLVVYLVFVFAYPAPWLQRLYGALVGVVVLNLVNVARLTALAVIAGRRPQWFAYFHEYFFQGLFIALLAFLGSVWTEQVRRAVKGRVPR